MPCLSPGPQISGERNAGSSPLALRYTHVPGKGLLFLQYACDTATDLPATHEDLHRLRAVANVSYAEKRELMGPEHTYTHAHTPTPTYTHRSLADEILTLLVLLTRGPMSVPGCAWEWGALYFS